LKTSDYLNKHLVIITGPTAVGKTAAGIALARHYKTEIISADSRQIYREMSIGTAVPMQEELKTIKHHFIQTKSIFDYYNASMFEYEVLDLLRELFLKYDIVFMVGGSTLYIDAVCHGIDELPAIDHDIRNEVTQRYKTEGIGYLQETLKSLDPKYYALVDLKNPSRLMKAVEISIMTGRPYSSFLTAQRKSRPFNIIKTGINCEREILYNQINQRVDSMFSKGLESEALNLAYARENNAMKTVGYREIFDYFDGKLSLIEAIEQIKINTRRYAKRQITWFQRDKEMFWFQPGQMEEMIRYIDQKIMG
jgi:tRNA dimethylallyltransferase